jgi:toxin ParE1/3/4
MPRIGSTRRFGSSRARNIRQFPVKSYEDYLIFYIPAEDGIDVLRVLHGKRDIESILKTRF